MLSSFRAGKKEKESSGSDEMMKEKRRTVK
jgi:hypothetical protein